MKTAAGTYVQMDREDIEDWLNANFQGSWNRDPRYEGVYIIRFSGKVGVSMRTTLGRQDQAKGRGRASMNLRLISLITRQTINKKARDRSHFKRTTNWRVTWKKGVEHWRGVYKKAQGFYDTIAEIEDRETYKRERLEAIEKHPGWQQHPILSDFHTRLTKNSVLMPRQQKQLDDILAGKGSSGAQAKPSYSPKQQNMINILRALWVEAKKDRNRFLLDFTVSVSQQMADDPNRMPSPKQKAVIDKARLQYGI